jgi:hypothetical protein
LLDMLFLSSPNITCKNFSRHKRNRGQIAVVPQLQRKEKMTFRE